MCTLGGASCGRHGGEQSAKACLTKALSPTCKELENLWLVPRSHYDAEGLYQLQMQSHADDLHFTANFRRF